MITNVVTAKEKQKAKIMAQNKTTNYLINAIAANKAKNVNA